MEALAPDIIRHSIRRREAHTEHVACPHTQDTLARRVNRKTRHHCPQRKPSCKRVGALFSAKVSRQMEQDSTCGAVSLRGRLKTSYSTSEDSTTPLSLLTLELFRMKAWFGCGSWNVVLSAQMSVLPKLGFRLGLASQK